MLNILLSFIASPIWRETIWRETALSLVGYQQCCTLVEQPYDNVLLVEWIDTKPCFISWRNKYETMFRQLKEYIWDHVPLVEGIYETMFRQLKEYIWDHVPLVEGIYIWDHVPSVEGIYMIPCSISWRNIQCIWHHVPLVEGIDMTPCSVSQRNRYDTMFH